jgi:hypothetical protein
VLWVRRRALRLSRCILPCLLCLQVAVLPVEASSLSSNKPRVALGPAVAAGQVLKAQGYSPALVLAPEFYAQPDDTARAK